MTKWRYTYTGRGYLRFPELTASVQHAAGEFCVRVRRGGPSRVDVLIEGEGEAPNGQAIDEVARRVHGHVVVFSQAAIHEYYLGSIHTIDEAGREQQNAYGRTLAIPEAQASVCVPFQHMTDMGLGDLEELRDILATAKPIRPDLVEAIEHSLTRAEGNVEAFLANYSVLESVLGQRQQGVDAFIRRAEPEVENVEDSRGRSVTIYTKLRNAKGHPTGMRPDEASVRIGRLLPKLRVHVRAALIQSSAVQP